MNSPNSGDHSELFFTAVNELPHLENGAVSSVRKPASAKASAGHLLLPPFIPGRAGIFWRTANKKGLRHLVPQAGTSLFLL